MNRGNVHPMGIVLGRYALHQKLLLRFLLRVAELEEDNDLPVDIGKPLDKDQVTCVGKNAQFSVRDGLGEGSCVSERHVAVLGAVDYQRF